jgi:flagellin FlaB
MRENSEAFTGLEAAIVLIAFVVVASVFSFAVIGAGYFTTQTTERVLYSTISQTGSTPVLLGSVHGIKKDGVDGIGAIRFNVGISSGNNPISFENMVLLYSTSEYLRTYDQNVPFYDSTMIDEGYWGIIDIKPSTAAGDTYLEANEVYTIYLNLTDGEELEPGQDFRIEMNSPKTTTFIIHRSAPWGIDNINVLS